jgi:hypothetical protein
LTFQRQIGRNAPKGWVFSAREDSLSPPFFAFAFLDPQPAGLIFQDRSVDLEKSEVFSAFLMENWKMLFQIRRHV